MSEYSAWGGRSADSRDPFVPGQRPLPPPKPDPVRVILETKEDTARIDQKLDQLMGTPEEGEDRLARIVELLEALVTRVLALERQQVRAENATTIAFEAVALSLGQIADGLRSFGVYVPSPGPRPTSQG